jgi:hypothetical protein
MHCMSHLSFHNTVTTVRRLVLGLMVDHNLNNTYLNTAVLAHLAQTLNGSIRVLAQQLKPLAV